MGSRGASCSIRLTQLPCCRSFSRGWSVTPLELLSICWRKGSTSSLGVFDSSSIRCSCSWTGFAKRASSRKAVSCSRSSRNAWPATEFLSSCLWIPNSSWTAQGYPLSRRFLHPFSSPDLVRRRSSQPEFPRLLALSSATSVTGQRKLVPMPGNQLITNLLPRPGAEYLHLFLGEHEDLSEQAWGMDTTREPSGSGDLLYTAEQATRWARGQVPLNRYRAPSSNPFHCPCGIVNGPGHIGNWGLVGRRENHRASLLGS